MTELTKPSGKGSCAAAFRILKVEIRVLHRQPNFSRLPNFLFDFAIYFHEYQATLRTSCLSIVLPSDFTRAVVVSRLNTVFLCSQWFQVFSCSSNAVNTWPETVKMRAQTLPSSHSSDIFQDKVRPL